MIRVVAFAAIALSACTSAIPTAAVTDVQTALDSYGAALGVAQVALARNPDLRTRVDVLAAQAAPYVAAAQSGLVTAQTAPSLGALGAELLVEAAPYILAVPAAAP